MISKVKTCQGAGDWSNEHGTFYKFEYSFEDGAILSASHKKQEGFPIGAEVEYEIKGTNDHGSYGSIKKPDTSNHSNANTSSSGGNDPIQTMIVKQNALGHATELLKYNAGFSKEPGIIKSDDVIKLAEKYKDWVMKPDAISKPEQVRQAVQKVVENTAPTAQAPPPVNEVPDDLPF